MSLLSPIQAARMVSVVINSTSLNGSYSDNNLHTTTRLDTVDTAIPTLTSKKLALSVTEEITSLLEVMMETYLSGKDRLVT